MTASMFVTDAPVEVYEALGGRWPTKQQWSAISAPLEPSVLIAGAGSGKTAVMAARIVWLIVNGHAKANEILGLTFTNKAAESLLRRVRDAIRPLGLPDGEEPTVSTYHAFASGLIADYGLRAGIEPGAALLSEAQAWQLCAQLYSARTYEHMEARTLWHVSYVRQLADDCSNHLVDPREIVAWDEQFLEKIKNSSDKIAGKIVEASKKRIELAGVVEAYQQAKEARRVLDYGDQIRLASEIAGDARVVADFLSRYRFALLDEYQDTNIAQAKMLKRLMPDGYPVMAVGDPDQNIYAWRGASLHNLLAFPEQFVLGDGSKARILPLEVNFRSGARILSLANELIDHVSPQRRAADKVLRHFEDLGQGTVAVGLWPDQSAEAGCPLSAPRRLAPRREGQAGQPGPVPLGPGAGRLRTRASPPPTPQSRRLSSNSLRPPRRSRDSDRTAGAPTRCRAVLHGERHGTLCRESSESVPDSPRR